LTAKRAADGLARKPPGIRFWSSYDSGAAGGRLVVGQIFASQIDFASRRKRAKCCTAAGDRDTLNCLDWSILSQPSERSDLVENQ